MDWYSNAEQQAKEIRAKYLESCGFLKEPIPINASKLANFISEFTGIKIEQVVIPDLNHLRGMIVRYKDNTAKVFLSDQNNNCWKRFTFIKEVSHLFLETDPSKFNSDALKKASSLVDEAARSSNPELYQLEVSAIVAAMELLIPSSLKNNILHLHNVKKLSPYQIADRFKVPQKYVEYRLKQLTGDSIKK